MAPQQSGAVRALLRFFLGWYRFFALRFGRLVRRLRGTALSPSEERVVSGEAWDEFCDTLKAAGASLVAPGAPRDAFNQAEGYRYLARLTRAGLENFIECSDPEAPRLSAIANGSRAARICIGSDNPDNLYENATIDGAHCYVVKGTRGTVGYLGFGTQSGSYGGKGGLKTVDYLESDKIRYDGGQGAAATFTIVLSASRPADAPNWLRLDPRETREAMFIVRQTFGDRSKEAAATLSIGRVADGVGSDGGPLGLELPLAPPPVLTAEKLDAGLQSAAVLVAGASAMFAKWAHGFQASTNQLPLFSQEVSNKAGGDPNIRYFHSYWRLSPKLVMRIRCTPPPCRCWNFQLNNHWMESLDYRYHTVHTNSSLARADVDDPQSYTILVAHSDPNADGSFRGNWIETVGHECGTMCFRWVAPEVSDEKLPYPKVEVLTMEELMMSHP